VRLNVQLLEVATGQHLWAQRFDRELVDVFVVTDEITETVVSTLAGRVEAARLARARRMPIERLDAYDLLLRGKYHHHHNTPEDNRLAIEWIERALARDEEYALAHAWLACCLGQAMAFRPNEFPQLLEQAHREAERGRETDDDESECHRILAQIYINRRDLARSQLHQDRALALNPNDDRVVCAMGEVLTLRGHGEQAVAWVRKAMRLNPYHPESYWFHLGRALFHAGRDDEAGEALGRITKPRTRDLAYRAAALSSTDQRDRAVAALRAASPDFEIDRFVNAIQYEHETDRQRLRTALESVLADD